MKSWHKAMCALCGALLCVGLLAGAILWVAYDHDHYMKQYEKLEIAASLDMTEEDLSTVTRVLIDYCRGARDDLAVTVSVRGEVQPFFNEREESHMAVSYTHLAERNSSAPSLCTVPRTVSMCSPATSTVPPARPCRRSTLLMRLRSSNGRNGFAT